METENSETDSWCIRLLCLFKTTLYEFIYALSNLSLSVKYILILYFLTHSLNDFHWDKNSQKSVNRLANNGVIHNTIMLQSIGEMSGDHGVLNM